MKKITLFFICLIFAGVNALWAQNVQVSGVVTDAAGPIIGATVAVKSGNAHAMTDANGRYTITVPANATLVFTFLGMKTQEIAVSGRTTLNVLMEEDATRLEEVVIQSAYGSGRKASAVTGSVARVGSKSIESRPVSNVADALQGRVAGLQVLSSSGEPYSLPSLRIRGVGSLYASNTPLYVVDGTPISADAVIALNANDFESVQILKDAAATSIYGSRAANGIVYIVTKRGKSGEATITTRAQYGISSLAIGEKGFNVMNSKQLLDLQLEYGINGVTQQKYDELIASGVDTKWYKFFFKDTAPTYQADVSVQGGTDKVKYFVSGAYFFQDGLLHRSEFERYSARSNLEFTPKKWLRMGVNMAVSYGISQLNGYTFQASNSVYGGTMAAYSYLPYVSPYNDDGTEREYFTELGYYNSKKLMDAQPSQTNRLNLNGNAFLEIKPIDGLTIRSQFGLDVFDVRVSSKRYPRYPFKEYFPFYPASGPNGSATERFERWPLLTLTNTIEYKFNIANDHDFTVLAGHEGIKYNGSNFGMSTSGQSDDRLLLLPQGPTRAAPTHGISEYAFLSFFGTLNYSWLNKYFADFSIRNDASSRFGKDRRNALFFSAAGMWNVKRESFLENVDFINVLSAKISYGTTGNSSIGNYEHLATIGTGNYNNTVTWGLATPGNPELGWETQALLTVGVKAELLDRVRAEVEFYNRRSLDMLMLQPQPYTSGWESFYANIGKMSNTGIDVTLGVDILKTSDWLIEFNTTLNYNKNEITGLFYGLEEWIVPNTLVGYVVGRPVEFYLPIYAGVNRANGKQLWHIPGTNQVTETFEEAELQQMSGKPRYAPWTGGFELSVNWKGLYANAFFAWVGEKYIYNNDRYFYENHTFLASGDNQFTSMMNMWRQPGDVTSIPKFGESAQFDSRMLENASFLRMKNLTVGYNVPTSVLKHTKFFSSAKIYFTARNLFTITNYTGPDPEIDSNLTYGAYPNTRQFTVGLELTF